MTRGKITVIVLASVIIYILLCATFIFATPFMVTWGETKPWYLQVIIFVQDFPFNLIRRNGEVIMSLVFINALFWTLIITVLLYFIAYFTRKKKRNSKTITNG